MKTYTIINPLNNNYVYYYIGQIVESTDTCQVFTELSEATDTVDYILREMILLKKPLESVPFIPKVVPNYFNKTNYKDYL